MNQNCKEKIIEVCELKLVDKNMCDSVVFALIYVSCCYNK